MAATDKQTSVGHGGMLLRRGDDTKCVVMANLVHCERHHNARWLRVAGLKRHADRRAIKHRHMSA